MNNRQSIRPVLAMIAALLVLNAVLVILAGMTPTASAQVGKTDGEPIFNAAEQRRKMIEHLNSLNEKVNGLNDKLGRLEARLEKGITVKVSEMPAIKVDQAGK